MKLSAFLIILLSVQPLVAQNWIGNWRPPQKGSRSLELTGGAGLNEAYKIAFRLFDKSTARLREAMELLQFKGYTPGDAFVTQDENHESLVWKWEDHSESVATVLVYGRNALTGISEVSAMQFDAVKPVKRWHWFARYDPAQDIPLPPAVPGIPGVDAPYVFGQEEALPQRELAFSTPTYIQCVVVTCAAGAFVAWVQSRTGTVPSTTNSLAVCASSFGLCAMEALTVVPVERQPTEGAKPPEEEFSL